MPTRLRDHSSIEASTHATERQTRTEASYLMQRSNLSIVSATFLGLSSAPIFLIQRFAVGRGVTHLESCRDTQSICRTLACRVFDWGEILADRNILPRWAQQPSQTTFLFSLIGATTFLSISRELTYRDRLQTILLGMSIPVICAIGAVAGIQTLVQVMCFFHQSVALALALRYILGARDAPVEERVTFRGKG